MPWLRLLCIFFAVKLAHVVIIGLTPAQFDVSSRLFLAKFGHELPVFCSFHTRSSTANTFLHHVTSWLVENVIHRLVTWDAVYFADLFVGGLKYEHQYVFCPLWWRLIRSIPVPAATEFYSRFTAAVVLANTCHFLAAVVLYFYTYAVFENARVFSAGRMAAMASTLFILTPAAAFMTAPYSEPPAALFSFLCLYTRELGVGSSLQLETRQKRFANGSPALYLCSGVFSAVAFGLRANCLLLGIVYVYDLVWVQKLPRVFPILTGSILGAALVASQFQNYLAICPGGRGEWCNSALPSLFSFAQSHYWGIGLFKYWRLGNVPNFAFAAPTLALSALGTRYFARVFPVDRTVPVLLVNLALVVSATLMWHVQIVTRVHTFLPVVYWLVAGLATQPRPDRWWAKVAVGYFVVWGVVQVSLFGAFLPPA